MRESDRRRRIIPQYRRGSTDYQIGESAEARQIGDVNCFILAGLEVELAAADVRVEARVFRKAVEYIWLRVGEVDLDDLPAGVLRQVLSEIHRRVVYTRRTRDGRGWPKR